jgi:hypothetical protein
VVYWLRQYIASCGLRRTLLRTDAEAAMLAYQRAFSDTATMSEPLRIARKLVGEQHTPFLLQQVKGIPFNVVADCISRRRFDEARRRALQLFGCPLILTMC